MSLLYLSGSESVKILPITRKAQDTIDDLFVVDLETGESSWNVLKADPQNPTLSHFEEKRQSLDSL